MIHAPGFLKLVEDLRPSVREVSVEELRARPAAVHVIDVREDHEWQAGHVPGARHLSKGILERDIEAAIPDPDAELWLYCGGGFRSVLAADALQRMGYHNVASVVGGYKAWVNAGLPTEKP